VASQVFQAPVVQTLDSDLSGEQRYPSFEQLGPDFARAVRISEVTGNIMVAGILLCWCKSLP